MLLLLWWHLFRLLLCTMLSQCRRCHGKRCPGAKRGPGDVTLAFERLLSDSCYTNACITSPDPFLDVTDLRCIKYLNNAIYPRASPIILLYLRPACLYLTCHKPSTTSMCLMFDCVRKVVDSLVSYSIEVIKFQVRASILLAISNSSLVLL